MNFDNKYKKVLIIIGIIALTLVVIFLTLQSTKNSAIYLEETIKKTDSNVNVEVKRKNILFKELVSGVKSHNKHEASTLKEVVKARKTSNATDQKQAINVLVEKYPELKASSLYKNMLTEFATTENRITNHQKTFNEKINQYNRYVKSFPNKQMLGISGHISKKYKYIEFSDNLTKESTDSIQGLE